MISQRSYELLRVLTGARPPIVTGSQKIQARFRLNCLFDASSELSGIELFRGRLQLAPADPGTPRIASVDEPTGLTRI